MSMTGSTWLWGVLFPAVLSFALEYVRHWLALIVIVPLCIVAGIFLMIGVFRSNTEWGTAFSGLPTLAAACGGAWLAGRVS